MIRAAMGITNQMKTVKVQLDEQPMQLDDWLCECAQVRDVISHAALLVEASRIGKDGQQFCTASALISLTLALKIVHQLVASSERIENGKIQGEANAQALAMNVFETVKEMFEDLAPQIMHRIVHGEFVQRETMQ